MSNTYFAVFSGKTKDGERIFIYCDPIVAMSPVIAAGMYIKCGDGPLMALSPGALLDYHIDHVHQSVHLEVKSPQWTGKAVATRFDMVVEEGIDLPVSEDHIIRGTE